MIFLDFSGDFFYGDGDDAVHQLGTLPTIPLTRDPFVMIRTILIPC